MRRSNLIEFENFALCRNCFFLSLWEVVYYMQLPIAPGVCLTCNLFVLATVHKMETFFPLFIAKVLVVVVFKRKRVKNILGDLWTKHFFNLPSCCFSATFFPSLWLCWCFLPVRKFLYEPFEVQFMEIEGNWRQF